MAINLFANVLNNDAIDNLTPAQADQVLAIFNKPKPRVAPISPEVIADTLAIVTDILNTETQEV